MENDGCITTAHPGSHATNAVKKGESWSHAINAVKKGEAWSYGLRKARVNDGLRLSSLGFFFFSTVQVRDGGKEGAGIWVAVWEK